MTTGGLSIGLGIRLAVRDASPPKWYEKLTEVNGPGDREVRYFGKKILTALHDFAAR